MEYNMELQLKGKNALISGSSRGIGLTIALALHNEGCNIVINGRNKKKLKESAQKIGNNTSYFVADVTKKSECKKLVKHMNKIFGDIDILVCNVGDGKSSKPGNEKYSEWQKMMDINLNSAINLVDTSKNSLKKTSGSIVCISSIAGIERTDASIPYSIAKSALNSYVKNNVTPFAKLGIRINAVAPGNILFKGSTWERKILKNKKKVYDMLVNKVAMNRFGIPLEIANAVVFLSSSVSSFTTGNILVIDGGQVKS
jgi:3-oxoacyl-[acyl-carrier protein] reductase